MGSFKTNPVTGEPFDLIGIDIEEIETGHIPVRTENGWGSLDPTQSGAEADMFKAVYDTNDNGVVDDSERFGNQLPNYYTNTSNMIEGTNLFYTESRVSNNTDVSNATTHISRTDNPHSVTKAQVGLSNVDNTSDLNKPISNATQSALDLKANDNEVVHNTGNETVNGVKTFNDKIYHPGTYGELYLANNNNSIPIPAGASYTKIPGPVASGLSNGISLDAPNAQMTINRIGKYKIDVTFSSKVDTNIVTLRTAIFMNGVEQNQIHSVRTIQNANEVSTAQIGGLLNVTTVPTIIDIRSNHDKATTVNITVEYANANIIYIGE